MMKVTGPQGGTQHVPTKAELEASLPPLRQFTVTLRQTEKVVVIAHEVSIGYAAVFQRYTVVGDGQVRQQMVGAFGGTDFVVQEDDELPYDATKSTLRIQ